jgi:hypothetical protein
MSNLKFTREQLKEIEKIFDIQASMLSSSYANLFNSIGKAKGSEEILIKLLREYSEAFTCYRTISEVANKLQEIK